MKKLLLILLISPLFLKAQQIPNPSPDTTFRAKALWAKSLLLAEKAVVLRKYKNNVVGDSILSTDRYGNVIMVLKSNPTFQQVTTAGAESSNAITISSPFSSTTLSANALNFSNYQTGTLSSINMYPGANGIATFPFKTGNYYLPATVNGIAADVNGNIPLNISSSASDSAITKYDLKATGNRNIDWMGYNLMFSKMKDFRVKADIFKLRRYVYEAPEEQLGMHIDFVESDNVVRFGMFEIYSTEYSNAVDYADAPSPDNLFSIQKFDPNGNLVQLVVERKNLNVFPDTIVIKTGVDFVNHGGGYVPGKSFVMKISGTSTYNNLADNMPFQFNAYVRDKFTGVNTPINRAGVTSVPFSFTTDPLSYGNRFQIIHTSDAYPQPLFSFKPDSTVSPLSLLVLDGNDFVKKIRYKAPTGEASVQYIKTVDIIDSIIGVANDQLITSVAWSPKLSLYVGIAGNLSAANSGKTFTSTDGVNWVLRTNANYQINQGLDLIWSDELGKFIACGYKYTGGSIYYPAIATSADGIAWVTALAGTNKQINSVAYSPELKMIVGLGNRNYPEDTFVYYSTDGGATMTENVAGFGAPFKVIWVKDLAKFICVKNTGLVSTSTDGINWTDITITTNFIRSFAYNTKDKSFLAYYGSGTFLKSTDGTTWSTAFTNANYDVQDLVYNKYLDRYIMVDGNKSVLLSTNGTTINKIYQSVPFTLMTGVKAFSYQQQKFILGKQVGSYPNTVFSTFAVKCEIY